VDAIESIGDGVEEYYAGGAEARGTWIGSAGASFGLSGPVDGDALRRVLAGLDPLDGTLLRGSSSPVRVAGFDLTFSAPKSVSVLFGIGDGELRTAVRHAHDRAALEAVGYLERSAAAVRRGHGGAEVVPAAGLVAAAFRHRTSRAGDPQLHSHVLVANLGRGPDGRWSALDGRRLRARPGGELRLPGGPARGADSDAWVGVVAGAERDRRAGRRPEAGAAGVQPPPR
jgi:conjugative relaxase-like TrwC/TraI family protein